MGICRAFKQMGQVKMPKVGRPPQGTAPRDTAEQLKQSALTLLARKGYSAVTIKDIAHEANLTTAMIYYHFKDKTDLVRATIEYAIENALQHFSKVSKNTDHPAALIHDWLQMHVSLQSDISKLLKLIVDYRHSDMRTPHIDAAIRHFYDTERELVASCIRRGQRVQVFKTGDPDTVSDLISTFLDGAMLRSFLVDDFDIKASIEMFETTLWTSLGFDGRWD